MVIREHQRLKKAKRDLELIYAELAFEDMDVDRLREIIHSLKLFMDVLESSEEYEKEHKEYYL